jgi:hypothetical protein
MLVSETGEEGISETGESKSFFVSSQFFTSAHKKAWFYRHVKVSLGQSPLGVILEVKILRFSGIPARF